MDDPARYADVNGLRTYYEIHGNPDGDPLLLLHGGFGNANNFHGMRPALAEHYQLIVPERRGHGHTPDLPGPITYDNMAEDTIAFMAAIGLERAHLVGWSDGAMVGLLVALQAPERVSKLAFLSQHVNLAGRRIAGESASTGWTVDTVPPAIKRSYEKRSPDGPEHFPVVFEKMMRLFGEEPELPIERLAEVRCPTLIAAADVDILSLEHAVAQFSTIPNAQLAIVPDASHSFPMDKPELTAKLVLDFLRD
jgi:pimeloyl-ACP methyl ester carboxylesterase